jgi:chromosomal replication initiation ATPase DnaA
MTISPYIYPGLPKAFKSNLNVVLYFVCLAVGVSIENIGSKSRQVKTVMARHIYCYYARKTTGRYFSDIGALIHRDHATVIQSIIKIENLISVKDKMTVELVNKIEENIQKN